MNKPVVVISGANGVAAGNAARAFAAQGASLALPEDCLLTSAVNLRSPEEVCAAGALVITQFGRADILLHMVGGWTGGKTLAETASEDLEAKVSQRDTSPQPGAFFYAQIF